MSLDRPHYLFIKHSEGWNVDRCSRWMQANGLAVEWCYPASGQPFPDPARYDGVVVFGGAGSANDCGEHRWVRDELLFIERTLALGVPYLGICLGAQMLARVLGARVAPDPDGRVEIGFHRIDPTPAGAAPGPSGAPFLAAPLTVMQWHTEGFELPSGAVRLATSEAFPNQAFALEGASAGRANEGRADPVLGVQFHPEVNAEVLAIWHARNRARRPGQLSEAERASMVADAHRHHAAIDAWLDALLGRWTRRRRRAA